jgi:uncharacterized membrane protein
MKKIWTYLTSHFRQDFHPRQYLFILLFLATSLTLNYLADFEDSFLDKQRGLLKVLYFFITYATAYYIVLLSYTLFRKQHDFWRQRIFWVKSLLAIGILSVDSSMPFLKPATKIFFPPETEYFMYKIGLNVCSLVVILVPLLIFYRNKEKQDNHIYGLAMKNFDYRPYLLMLMIMVPLIAAASFEPSFLRQYPMYKNTQAHDWFGVPPWTTAIIYEFTYGLDFITVEFLFRGFMVIGMATILGRSAILPMAAAYCFIHFGKPAGEAISSIVGGTILGIIALETKSIWGGIIVHIGIAWMMELAAYLQKINQ